MTTNDKTVGERFCNKCGYWGHDVLHQRPNGTGQCGYLSCITTTSKELAGAVAYQVHAEDATHIHATLYAPVLKEFCLEATRDEEWHNWYIEMTDEGGYHTYDGYWRDSDRKTCAEVLYEAASGSLLNEVAVPPEGTVPLAAPGAAIDAREQEAQREKAHEGPLVGDQIPCQSVAQLNSSLGRQGDSVNPDGVGCTPCRPKEMWTRRWYGSAPWKGWTIMNGREEIAFLGEAPEDTVDAIIDAHNSADNPALASREQDPDNCDGSSFGCSRECGSCELNPSPNEPPAVDAGEKFQERVKPWLLACFGEQIAGDRDERNHRFLEEALELVQACGCTASEAHQLVDYTFGRPAGEKAQEVGGVMVTLAALCLAQDLDMAAAGDTELARIWTKVEQIRAKQAAKPKHSPLPAAPTTCRLDDGRCGICGGDWSVCGCDGMLRRASAPGPDDTPLKTGEGDAR
jgi:hypothetical protein